MALRMNSTPAPVAGSKTSSWTLSSSLAGPSRGQPRVRGVLFDGACGTERSVLLRLIDVDKLSPPDAGH